jgi:type IV secretion system protein VirD4
MLQQMGKRLTETMSVAGPGYSHRLLMLLDEFPTLGRLSFFESALAFSAGYGIKCFLICQSLNQLEAAYGRDNSIVDNCHVRMAYAANRVETAKTISDLMGQATFSKRQRSVSGRGLFGARSVSESDHEFARPLLTPDEVLRLPFEDALLFIGGSAPYRARKVMYYLDRRLAPRAKLPPPDSDREQRRELVRRSRSDWETLAPIPVPAPTPQASAGTAQQAGSGLSGLGEELPDAPAWAELFSNPAADEESVDSNEDAEDVPPGRDGLPM